MYKYTYNVHVTYQSSELHVNMYPSYLNGQSDAVLVYDSQSLPLAMMSVTLQPVKNRRLYSYV